MKVDTLPIGLYGENSYILHDENHVLFIDPGAHAKEIERCVSSKETVEGIVLTHGHEDHVGAVDDLVECYHCPVYLHEGDFWLVDPKGKSTGYSIPLYCNVLPLKKGNISIGSFNLTIYETPGHTPGSVCVQYHNRLFTGDTLFAGSIGRTDLAGGNAKDMQKSIDFLKTLPSDLWVYPGHGDATTLQQEKRSNVFMVYGVDAYI